MQASSRVLWPDDDERDAHSSPARQQLYERLLGASFARLPAPLRRFHARPGGTAEFAMEVTYEPGALSDAEIAELQAKGHKLKLSTRQWGNMQVITWDFATGKELKKFEGHTDGVQGVCFGADGRTVFSASWDKTVRKWRLPSDLVAPAAKKDN